MTVKERIQQLQTILRNRGIHAYIVPSSDPHQSEYVAPHYASRAFITGFTGSAGTAVITQSEAGLWTDGRYFVQAERELKDTGVTLFKSGEAGVPTIEEYLKNIPNGSVIGFDGRVISVKYFQDLKQQLASKDFIYVTEEDLIAPLWTDRPAIPVTDVISHEIKYTGCSREEKIAQVRRVMEKLGATHYVLSGLDDIAWLFNIRGRDIPYNPLTIAYAMISMNQAILFIDERKIKPEILAELQEAKIELFPYEKIKTYLDTITEGVVLYDPNKLSVWLQNSIKVSKIEQRDITTDLKAVKNNTELENIRNCMVRDGVAMVKFLHWLTKTIQEREISEIEAADRLTEFRRENDLYYDNSFATISAYRENAAMPHYHATKENYAMIKPAGFYLVDSGGQYYDGTTDITRTIRVGELTEEEMRDYTLVLKGMINLSQQVFIAGATGSQLDIIARKPLWDHGMDYKHGTGHGIGYFLNVHEGPHRIASVPNLIKLEPGMIVSNEPGVYKMGKHGIRIENLIVVQKDRVTEYGGQFMKFETLTLCPIDTTPIDKTYLTEAEINWLNQYHKLVYDRLSPHLSGEALEYLKQATMAI